MSSQYPFYNFFSDKLFDCLCLQQKNLKNHHLSCMFLIDCLIWSLWEGPHLFVKIFQFLLKITHSVASIIFQIFQSQCLLCIMQFLEGEICLEQTKYLYKAHKTKLFWCYQILQPSTWTRSKIPKDLYSYWLCWNIDISIQSNFQGYLTWTRK